MTESNIKEKIGYEQGRCKDLEEKIAEEGGSFNPFEILMHANLQIIKKFLFDKKIIDANEFELEFYKKVLKSLESVLKAVKELKKKRAGLIIPNANIDLSKIVRSVKA